MSHYGFLKGLAITAVLVNFVTLYEFYAYPTRWKNNESEIKDGIYDVMKKTPYALLLNEQKLGVLVDCISDAIADTLDEAKCDVLSTFHNDSERHFKERLFCMMTNPILNQVIDMRANECFKATGVTPPQQPKQEGGFRTQAL